MEKSFFDEMQPCIVDKLGKFYNCNAEYNQAICNESELFRLLEDNLTEGQIQC